MKIKLLCIAIIAPFYFLAAQITVTSQNTLIKSGHNFGLTNPVYNDGSPMVYNPSDVEAKGGAFSLNYTNQGGTNFDGYPSGAVGGFKSGGVYNPGVASECGMPVQIQNLTDNLRINWKTSQFNANDPDDRWWATINVIFDNGTETSQPNSASRDYDLVIQNVSYLQDDFTDLINPGGRYWYFAREIDGSIKPYTVYLNGTAYSWAVRYKFFDYPTGHPNENKNDKVHIKFIPIDNSNPIPNLDHSLKAFIDCTKNYISYLSLNSTELALANSKVAEDTLWIKSISAGYEIYEGSSTLVNDYFYTTIDNTPPIAVTNLNAMEQTSSVELNWDASTDNAFDYFTIYRAENGGNFSIVASEIRTDSFVDNTLSLESYEYYVTATDRSLNESDPSHNVLIDLGLTTLIPEDDAYVRNGANSTTNYGNNQNLQIQNNITTNTKRITFLKFNLDNIHNVTSAILRVYNTAGNGTVNIRKANNDNWEEELIIWNNKPSTTALIGNYIFNGTGAYDLDVTNYVSQEADGDNIVTFAIKGNTANYMSISSKDGINTPELIIEHNDDNITQKSLSNSKVDNKEGAINVKNEIFMYPNPTKSVLNIEIEDVDDEFSKIEVFDSLGRLIQQKVVTGSRTNLQLEGSTGIYLVKVQNKGRVVIKRIIKN